MKLKQFLITAAGAAVLALASNTATAQWTDVDIGTQTPGSLTPNGGTGYTQTGSGADIWNATDDFNYYYQNVTGLWWDSVVQVISLAGGDATWAKCELMVRQDDGSMVPSGPDAFIGAMTTKASGQNEIADQFRPSPSGSGANWFELSPVWRPSYPNQWMRMERKGSVFNMYFGTDGTTWNQYASFDTSTTANGFNGVTWSNRVLIGMAVTSHSEGQLATAVYTNLSVTVHTITPPTGQWAQFQPTNATTHAYAEASFYFHATNNAVPVGIIPNAYQWYKNGTPVTNATGTSYTFLTEPTDNNAQMTCVVTAPGYSASLTSAVATLTVQSPTFYTNGLKHEFFAGGNRTAVENGTAGPGVVSVISTFDAPTGLGNNYGRRVSGWFIAPATTNYIFYVASDDDCDLWLSTDSSPSNKRIIAQETAWCGLDAWGNPDGFGSHAAAPYATQYRSDWWMADPTTPVSPTPYAEGIALTAGNLYYIEADMHQGGGGDNLSVTFNFPATNTVAGESYTPAPTNGTLSAISNDVVLASWPLTTFSFSKQPKSLTVFEGQIATFSTAVVTDSEFVPLYQWYRNGSIVTNANSSALAWTTVSVAADNGAQFLCVAKSQEGGISLTSQVAVLTVQAAVFEPGIMIGSHWWDSALPSAGYPGNVASVVSGTAPLPIFTMAIPGFEMGVNNENGDNFVNQVKGLFVPPTSGNYVFFVNSDDQSELYLSTDDTAANKKLIAEETGWSNPNTWVGVGSGDVTAKRSDQFTGATNWPTGNTITLTAGKKYYMEAVHSEGGGGDNLEVNYKLETDPDPANGAATIMVGSVIGFYAPPSHIAVTANPQPATAISGTTTATFTAGGTNDSPVGFGTTGLYYGGTPVDTNGFLIPTYGQIFYQWYRNGTAIPGATLSSYTTSIQKPVNNGDQYVCGVHGIGSPWSNTLPAVLTVITDTVPPTVTYAGIYTNSIDNTNGGFNPPVTYISVAFSKLMDVTTLGSVGSYSVAGATVQSVIVNTNDGRSVILAITGTPTGGVTVSNVRDFSGNLVSPTGNTASVKTLGLTFLDIGLPSTNTTTLEVTPDPAYPSTLFIESSNSFTVTAEGSDIWNAADGFNFLYETKTNDFDVVVRGVSITHSSEWAKMGLMMRETLDPGSRNWNLINDPLISDGIPAPDGTGFGANNVEANYRGATTNATNAGWATNTTVQPVYPNAWLRLKRTGNSIDGFTSTNGLEWNAYAHADPTTVGDSNALPAVVYVGLCTSAHNNDTNGAPFLIFQNTARYADYNSHYVYVPPVQGPIITVNHNPSAGTITIGWSPAGGHLTASPALSGAAANWQAVTPATNPVTLPATGGPQFFRVVTP